MAGRPPGDSADGKKRLLDACWELLVETPQGERLTIAAVCERARCTPPTLYHHFGDLASLERAASRRAYVAWNQDVESTCGAIKDPHKRLAARGEAYLQWALRNPDAYTVLFSLPRKAEDPNTASLQGAGLQSLVQDIADVHQLPSTDPSLIPLAFAYWAGVHGLASLSISVPYFPENIRETTLAIMTEAFTSHIPAEAPAWAASVSFMDTSVEEERELRKAS